MKKFLSLFLLLPLLVACSDDFSDCEKIGHIKGDAWTTEECAELTIPCNSKEDENCKKIQSFDKSTDEGCRGLIDFLNKLDEDANYILRCPLTKSRKSNKTSDKYKITSEIYVYNDGTVINISDLLNDKENIYISPTFEPDKFIYFDSQESNGYRLNNYNK